MYRNINVTVNSVFLLGSVLTSSYVKSEIENYFRKKSHSSDKDNYKEGSDSYLKEVAKDLEITLIPDYNINANERVVIESSSFNKIEYSLGTYKTIKNGYDYDTGKNYSNEVEYFFLVENSHWGTGLICSIDELITTSRYKDLLFQEQKAVLEANIQERLNSLSPCFTLLSFIVLDAIKAFKNIGYYTKYKHYNKCVVIDKEVFDEVELSKIYDDYINEIRFYDDRDKKIDFWGYGNSYLEYHKKYAPKQSNIAI